jgi:homeodomain-containing protein
VVEVAAGLGTSRQTIHTWLARYLSEGLGGLADRSHRPRSSPLQVEAAVEARVAELRRAHPRWGATRIRPYVVVAKIPLTQLIAPGFDGVPVSSGTIVKKLNLIAGLS